jgi:hypothetical protein
VPLVSTPLTTATITAAGTVAAYTISTSAYNRDIILTNGATGSGTAFTVFVATGANSVSTGSGFPIPPGGTLIMAGGQGGGQIGSSNNVIYATCVSAATLVVGLGSVISNI